MVIVSLELNPELCYERFQFGFVAIEFLWVRMVWQRSRGRMTRGDRALLHQAELFGK